MKRHVLVRLFYTVILMTSLIFYIVFSAAKDKAESWYGHGIYPAVRGLMEVLPWPTQGLMMTLAGMISILVYLMVRVVFIGERTVWTRIYHVVAYLGLVVMSFYWCWGFNYMRPELPDRLGVTLADPDTAWLFDELTTSIDRMNLLCHQTDMRESDWSMEALGALHRYMIDELGYHEMRPPSLSRLRPEGGLLRWSTAGMYWPYTGQPHVDAGLHPLTWPATQLHEWGHAYGVTSEADCNFIAYEIARRSDDPYISYSGERLWHRHLARACLIADETKTRAMLSLLDSLVYRHSDQIRAQHGQYGRWMPDIRDAVYDTFLRANRVAGGIKSYSYVVRLRYAVDQQSELFTD